MILFTELRIWRNICHFTGWNFRSCRRKRRHFQCENSCRKRGHLGWKPPNELLAFAILTQLLPSTYMLSDQTTSQLWQNPQTQWVRDGLNIYIYIYINIFLHTYIYIYIYIFVMFAWISLEDSCSSIAVELQLQLALSQKKWVSFFRLFLKNISIVYAFATLFYLVGRGNPALSHVTMTKLGKSSWVEVFQKLQSFPVAFLRGFLSFKRTPWKESHAVKTKIQVPEKGAGWNHESTKTGSTDPYLG